MKKLGLIFTIAILVALGLLPSYTDGVWTNEVFGGAIAHCDCETSGNTCQSTYGAPSSCTSDQTGWACTDSYTERDCNTYDAWDWSDCVQWTDHICHGQSYWVCVLGAPSLTTTTSPSNCSGNVKACDSTT